MVDSSVCFQQECNASSSSRSLLSRLIPLGTSHRRNQTPPRLIPGKQQRNLRTTTAASGAAAVVQREVSGRADAPAQTSSRLTAITPLKQPCDLGFPRHLGEKYILGRDIGSGGNGIVRIAVNRETGEQYACKSILKEPSNISEKKRSEHLQSIQREVETLSKLSGSLNVIKMFDCYEDDCHVHIIMENCTGGELHHTIGSHHYSERTVASYMRAVLRTLAQCHSHHILHRDIKPGNFMLLTPDDRAPLKAIDFGLATPYNPQKLPCTDLGLEGTPWFMAPEVLSGKVLPASDIWSAGVMAYQLLSGFFPFDDARSPHNASLSAVWKSILTDKLNFRKSAWAEISDDAKDFIKTLLDRDPAKRPTAKEALQHPWLAGNSSDRSMGKRLHVDVVQRIQRFAQSSVFKRSVLQSMAAEMLQQQREGEGNGACTLGSDGRLALTVPQGACMQQLLEKLHLTSGSADRSRLADSLQHLGFRLAPSEAERLLQHVEVDADGCIDRVAFTASLLDWRLLQEQHLDNWLEIAKTTFEHLDQDCDGVISTDELVDCLRQKVPEAELSLAVQQTLEEAACTEDRHGIDFPGFLRMLRPGSVDSLDQYDGRLSCSASLASSLDRLNDLLDRSLHGARTADSSNHSVDSNPSVGASSPAPLKPSPFRFDVPKPKAQPAASPPAALGQLSARAAVKPVPYGNNLGMMAGCRPASALQARPGFQERRMHGSNLYHNALLATVNE